MSLFEQRVIDDVCARHLPNGVFHNDVHILQTSSGVSKIKRGLRALFGGAPLRGKLRSFDPWIEKSPGFDVCGIIMLK